MSSRQLRPSLGSLSSGFRVRDLGFRDWGLGFTVAMWTRLSGVQASTSK